MPLIQLTLRFGPDMKGYIADPYWPAMATLIDVEKQSGMNRAKSSANRAKALEEYLRANGKTLDWYDELKRNAKKPFYQANNGEIVIPETQFSSFLMNACKEARAAYRPCPPEQVHALFRMSDFVTGKTDADGTWERFALVTSGTGAKLSNQRGFRSSEYIRDFEAVGTISFDEQYVKPETLHNALKWGGQFIGIGASRKMGWGRFEVSAFRSIQG